MVYPRDTANRNFNQLVNSLRLQRENQSISLIIEVITVIVEERDMSIFSRCMAKVVHKFILRDLDRFVNKNKKVFEELATK